MPTDDVSRKLSEMDTKIDAIYKSVEKTRKYILTTMIITIAVVVVPLFGLVFAIPSFLGTYSQLQNIGSSGY